MSHKNQTQTDISNLTDPVSGAENFLRWSSTAILRGGRVTKSRGIVASYPPELGLVSAGSGNAADGGQGSLTLSLARRLLRWSVAPIALLAAQSPAFAQDACVEVALGEFVCEDNGDPATTEQSITGDNVTVTIEDGFDIDTSISGVLGLNVDVVDGIAITQAGTSSITGGVLIENVIGAAGGGALNVTFGDVNGGVTIFHTGADSVLDTSAGTVSSLSSGIFTITDGSGDAAITTGDVIGGTNAIGIGIYSINRSGSLTIDSSAGTVSGGYRGIRAENFGSGALSITTANVDGEIEARNYGTDLTIDTSAGAVTGGEDGIDARNEGAGDTIITTADVTGTGIIGVRVFNAETAGNMVVDTTAGSVNANRVGIQATSRGSGDTIITTADVTANDGSEGTGIS
ncbi:hypothetical protein MNBD_ALPHA04-1159, partial [hydrothermal vent metagenome]